MGASYTLTNITTITENNIFLMIVQLYDAKLANTVFKNYLK